MFGGVDDVKEPDTSRWRRGPLRAGGWVVLAFALFALGPSSASAYSLQCYDAGIGCISPFGYTGQSVWGYPVDGAGNNCTNYAAFRLSRNGAANPGNLGNAGDWAAYARAKGFAVNGTPAVGAIAQWNYGSAYSPRFGHVAYVEEVSASAITLSDSNWQGGSKRWRVSPGDSQWPSNFVHIRDVVIAQPAPSVAGEAVRHRDFNGDGLADAVWQDWNGALHALKSNGSRFVGVALTTGYGKPDWAGMGDVNGDKKADIILAAPNGIHTLLSDGSRFGPSGAGAFLTTGYANPMWAGVDDFNGDGLADVVWQDWNGALHALKSNGSRFVGVALTTGYGKPDWAGMGDVNGDKKADIIFAAPNGIHTLLSDGSRFGPSGAGAFLTTGYANPMWAGPGGFPSTVGWGFPRR